MTEYNKVETQDGYTKVRTHDFVAIENELAALRAERDELREVLEEIANGRYGKSVAVKNIARAVLAKYAGKKE